MWNSNSPEIRRNSGFFSKEQQEKLLESKVAVAGCGGAGYGMALHLARLGVQHFSLADPDSFGAENLNRVPGAKVATLGQNKAEVLAEEIHSINPEAKIDVYSMGVTPDNIDYFAQNADTIFEGIDVFEPGLSVMVYRWCRKAGIAAVTGMEIGRSGVTTSFHPDDSRFTYEDFLGVEKDTPIDEIKGLALSSTIPYLPNYEDIDVLYMAAKDEIPLPTITTGVGLESAITADQVCRHLAPDKTAKPIWANKWAYIDIGGNRPKGGIIRPSKLNYYMQAGALAVRCGLGFNRKSGGYGDVVKK